ncbi:MAG: hypothetical protein JST30_14620 [Armatimonadetes bacterium]|nr:hypothetical protein [Armatimonadota bacterium]
MKALLGMAFESLAGKDGGTVARRSKNGTILTPYVIPRNPNTTAQETLRSYFGKGSRAFKALNNTQVAQWQAYASGLTFRDDVTGKTYHPTDIAAFMQLAVKFLQVNPTGTVPSTPPAAPYLGDNVTVTALAGTGKVTFTSSGANTPNTKTELLLQPLKNSHWNPQPDGYRSKAFFAFVVGTLSTDVTVPPGTYAAGYRFVNTVTGQATDMVPIGVHQVTLSVEAGGSASKRKAA